MYNACPLTGPVYHCFFLNLMFCPNSPFPRNSVQIRPGRLRGFVHPPANELSHVFYRRCGQDTTQPGLRLRVDFGSAVVLITACTPSSLCSVFANLSGLPCTISLKPPIVQTCSRPSNKLPPASGLFLSAFHMLQFREVASSIAWAFQELYQKQISGASPVSPTKLADGRPCKLRDTPVTALPNSRWPRRLPVVNVNRARLITPLPACLQCFIPSTLKKDIFRFVFSPATKLEKRLKCAYIRAVVSTFSHLDLASDSAHYLVLKP